MQRYMFFDDVKHEVVGTGDFLAALRALSDGRCEYIYGPLGGILMLDEGAVVYRTPIEGNSVNGIYFDVTSYLGQWKFLKEVRKTESVDTLSPLNRELESHLNK